MLSMEMEVGLRNMERVGHVVIEGGSGETMLARSVLLGPPDGRVDRNMGDMDTLGHEFARHALRESGLGVGGHRERSTERISLEGGARVGKDDRAKMSVGRRISVEPSN